MLFYYFVDPRRLKKFMLMLWKSLFCFIRQFLVEKVANSNILLQKQSCFREQLSRVQIFTTSKNFYFDQQTLLFGFIVFSRKRDVDHDKKLNSILRRDYGFIMTASWEKIYSVLGFATPPINNYPAK